MDNIKNKDIRKGILIGLGLTSIALEKVEEVVRKHLKKKKVSKEKAKAIAKEALNKLKKSKKIADIIERELKKNIDMYIPEKKREKIAKKAYKRGKKIARKIIKKGIKKARRYY